ncbi:MAG TPA: hypothetical protein VD864_14725 [Nocardioides sp.]|nr:hypothetical protein [Nocardioides sp.]
MTAYVYALQEPETVREAKYFGKITRVGQLLYAYKLAIMGNAERYNAQCERERVAPLRRAWKGKAIPAFVVIGDWYEGQEVYRWPRGWIACEDDPNFGRTVRRVGYLRDGTISPE